jgi:hypothetical protein
MYIRPKKKDNRIYYYLVEGKRIKDKVSQKVVRYLGTAKNILKRFQLSDKQVKKRS